MDAQTCGSKIHEVGVMKKTFRPYRVWLQMRRWSSNSTSTPFLKLVIVGFPSRVHVTELTSTVRWTLNTMRSILCLTVLDCSATHHCFELFLALILSASCLPSCILVLLLFVVGGLMMRPNCFCNGDSPCCLSWMSFRTEDTTAVHC